jgi:competence protein ComEC
MEASLEQSLLFSGALGQADLLKVGHHGSKTSTSDLFLDAVRPEVAVISVGEKNRYGHPHTGVLERLRARGVRVFRTDRDGDVFFQENDETFLPVRY